MYSEQFMAYLVAYQKDELKEPKKEKRPRLFAFIKSVFKTIFKTA